MGEKFPISEQPKSPEKEKKIEKPAFLYHASPNKDIKIFEPRAESVRDPKEGPVVFAAKDIGFAAGFLIKLADRWTNIGKFGDVPYIIIGDKEKFLETDKGGAIYVLPGNKFDTDPDKGMGEEEWTSKRPVRPINRIEFTSALQAMLDNGVQVFFVTKEVFKKISHSKDHGADILKNIKSENQKRGMNYRPFEE